MKFKLEIVSINEDVISTSGNCAYTGDTGWVLYNGLDEDTGKYEFYPFDNNNGTKVFRMKINGGVSNFRVYDQNGDELGGVSELKVGKHYHIDIDNLKFYLCEDDGHNQAYLTDITG